MNARRFVPGLLLAFALGVTLPGCISTTGSRIQEKAAQYDRLDAATQEHIRKGLVENGYTADMVYMALGPATETKVASTPDGEVEIWSYKNMTLARKAGFRGLTYNTNMNITPTTRSGRPGTGMGKQAYSTIDLDRMDSASELPDLPMGTLRVYFFQGRVYKMMLKL